MSGEQVMGFALFWGVWLLVPLLVDGVTALVYLVGIWLSPHPVRRSAWLRSRRAEPPPLVSVIVPMHNARRTLRRCLDSLAAQDYPPDRLEIICVDNGSSDDSLGVFSHSQTAHRSLSVQWVSLPVANKARALNAGIHMARGSLVICLDADVRLDWQAVSTMTGAFMTNPGLVAATGSVEVEPVRDGRGSIFTRILTACESLEYLGAFRVGRRYQTLTDTLYTLSGAFSAFRREALLATFLYDDATVSEDTKLTLDLRTQQLASHSLGCVDDAVAYVEPIRSLKALYAQRVRWQRGQLEVAAFYPPRMLGGLLRSLRSFVGRLTISDHTLAFPRLVWTFLLPFLFLLGYPTDLVLMAWGSLYLCYVAIEGLQTLTIWAHVPESYHRDFARFWAVVPVMPVYRFMLYWFRFSGILLTLTEPAAWKVVDPFTQLGAALGGSRASPPAATQDLHRANRKTAGSA
ncbi:MAG: glycosyltransferase [Bacillota bacterium]